MQASPSSEAKHLWQLKYTTSTGGVDHDVGAVQLHGHTRIRRTAHHNEDIVNRMCAGLLLASAVATCGAEDLVVLAWAMHVYVEESTFKFDL